MTMTAERGLAETLARHSYTRVALPPKLARNLSSLAHRAEALFGDLDDGDDASTERHRRLVPCAGTGGLVLHGYAEPSPAKQLFRFFPGDGDDATTDAASSLGLPGWLLEDCSAGMMAVAEETLAAALRGALVSSSSSSSSTTTTTTSTQNGERAKLEKDALCLDYESRAAPRRGHSECPLDIFRYRNESTSAAAAAAAAAATAEGRTVPVPAAAAPAVVPASTNCSAHIDRGLVHVIASSSPGLQVLYPTTGIFHLVDEPRGEDQDGGKNSCTDGNEGNKCDGERSDKKRRRRNQQRQPQQQTDSAESYNPGPDSARGNPFRSAVVITNAALQEYTLQHADEGKGDLVLPACVHQVVGVAGKPRLSISFELRLPEH